MAELVSLPREPLEEEMIERLEKLLDKVRKGDVSSLALAWVDRDGMTGSGFSRAPFGSQLAGAISALQYKQLKHWLS